MGDSPPKPHDFVEAARKAAPWLTAGVAAFGGWVIGPMAVDALASWFSKALAKVPEAAKMAPLLASLVYLGVGLIGAAVAGTSTTELMGIIGIGVFFLFLLIAARGFVREISKQVGA